MIDKSKTYRTRDGREVRIYATDCGRENNMVHGAVQSKDGWWGQCSWYQNGKFFDGPHDHELDLIEVRPRHKRTVWLNIYREYEAGPYKSRSEADFSDVGRIACIKVGLDFEEGEGL